MSIYSFRVSAEAYRVRRLERAHPYARYGEIILPSGDYTAVSSDSVNASGQIDATSGIQPVGSLGLAISDTGFSYTATDTTVTVYWDGTNSSRRVPVRRADGTMTVAPKGSLTITGLTANTTYYLLPFFSPLAPCPRIGFVPGDAGKGRYAHAQLTSAALQQQRLLRREPLETLTVFTNGTGVTTASAPSGAGAGGDSGEVPAIDGSSYGRFGANTN